MNQLIQSLKLGFASLVVFAFLSATGCTGPRSDAAPAIAAVDDAQAAAPPPALTPPAAAPPPARAEPVLAPPVASRPDTSAAASGGLACRSNADCVVKDVGSCCGYQPRCLNTKAETFPERVREKCASEGRVSTCGFREIAGCECVQGKCAAIHDAADGGLVR